MKLTKKITRLALKIYSNKYVKWILIPGLLLLLWISLSLFYSSYRSFSVLQFGHDVDISNNFGERKLLKNEKIQGIFEAKENYLGIISVRFGDVQRVDFEDEDVIIFRIREVGKDWLYENRYRTGSFVSNQYFPFGFKQIENSKGKVYEFELISLNGDVSNSVETKNTNPIYFSKYKFPKNEVLRDGDSFIKFMSKKLITFVTNYEALLSSFAFLIPFIFFMLWILFFEIWVKSKGIINGRNLFITFVSILIISEIIFYEFLINGFMLGFLALWIFSVYMCKLKSTTTFTLAFILIAISLLSIYFDLEISADKASTYAYFLIIVGFAQSIGEHKNYKLNEE